LLRVVAGDAALFAAGSPQYDSLLNTEARPALTAMARADDVAMLVYTSGTTGRPKGVCLTQAALAFNAVTIALAQGLRHEDVFLTTTPLYHVASGTRVTTMLLDGQAHVVMPSFDTESFFEAVESYGVTTTVVVPTQLRRIIESAKPDDARLRTLRLLVYGAAPTSLTLIKRALSVLRCGFYQGYGLTEACTNLTGLLPSDHVDGADERLRSCGRPVPGVEIGIYDSRGERLPAHRVGEIRVRTEKLMAGYWRDPAATSQALTGGWLRTGDMGRVDEAGYLTIVGRAKDMLISGGVNVYPSEIEAVLHLHPAVAEAAVVGHPDEEWGEIPVAFVIPRQDARVSPGEIQQFCRERLAGLKVPRRVELVEDLPRTASGKVRKVELRA
jgi:long-chain acyl-CoA synthetase